MVSYLMRLVLLLWAFCMPVLAHAAPVNVVNSFSILGDLVQKIGGKYVSVVTLVGPDQDIHSFEPGPHEARQLATAELVFVNGLGLESWMTRLLDAAEFDGKIVTVSEGIKVLKRADGSADPHAWQSLANIRIYLKNIKEALIEADPKHKVAYELAEKDYLKNLRAFERRMRYEIEQIPAQKRKVITTHDAFAYLGEAYGITFIPALLGSEETEPTAREFARLIDQIEREKVQALFFENTVSPSIIKQLEREHQAFIGGTLYSDALSKSDGPAAGYRALFEHNMALLLSAMRRNPG